ncbi:hypothetical protein BDW74DRAFT_183250 [Aspergillus multicolor]|uniref:uncharacterized protein n=1 Tax=Aspergillus multicolor TaxID=41759 RepID=UPI003CCD0BFC
MQKLELLLPDPLQLPPAREDTSSPLEKSVAQVAVECLAPLDGRVDSQELKKLIQLADEMEEKVRAASIQTNDDDDDDVDDEHLDFEINDIGVDTLYSELFVPGVDDDNDDMDSGHDSPANLQSAISRCTVAQRRSPEWRRKRRMDKKILEEGVKYGGSWQLDQKGRLLVHVLPVLAHIVITSKSETGWRDEFAPEILVGAEIDAAMRHPNCWALDSRDTDPGAKLALIVDGGKGDRYVNAEGEGSARKANTFVDWLFGCSLETIASRPRRHIHAGKGDPVVKALKLDTGGTYYTDDHGRLIQSQRGANSVVSQTTNSDI